MNDKDIADGFRSGDGQKRTEAFNECIRRYRLPCYRTALKYLKSHDLAEEVAQEAFLLLWLKGHLVDNYLSYLFTVSKNCSLAYLRKIAADAIVDYEFLWYSDKSSKPDSSLVSPSFDPDGTRDRILEDMRAEDVEICNLKYKRGLSNTEIAVLFGCTPNAVAKRLERLLKALKKEAAKRRCSDDPDYF